MTQLMIDQRADLFVTSCARLSALFLGAMRTGFTVTAAPNFALAGSTIASAHGQCS